MLSYFVFAVLVSLAFADTDEDNTFPGKCPELSPAENFDINRYVKDPWYKVYYHGKGSWYKKLQCPECRLSYNAESNSLFVEKYYLNDSHPVWHNKSKEYLADHPGIFQYPQSVRDEKSEWWYKVQSKVVQTDYANYAVIWGCYEVEGQDKHYEFVFINSRQRSLATQYLDEVKAYFKEHYSGAEFHPIYWEDCRARCPEE